jgi:hypothetical protein
VQLKAQLTARDQYIRQNAERWGLSEGDIAILTNQERTAADTAGARFDAVTQRGDEQFNWAQQRLTENLKSAFGDTWTAQVYDPQRDAQFKPLWDNALQLLGQWVMAGEPTDHRFVTTQRAFDDVRTTSRRAHKEATWFSSRPPRGNAPHHPRPTSAHANSNVAPSLQHEPAVPAPADRGLMNGRPGIRPAVSTLTIRRCSSAAPFAYRRAARVRSPTWPKSRPSLP